MQAAAADALHMLTKQQLLSLAGKSRLPGFRSWFSCC